MKFFAIFLVLVILIGLVQALDQTPSDLLVRHRRTFGGGGETEKKSGEKEEKAGEKEEKAGEKEEKAESGGEGEKAKKANKEGKEEKGKKSERRY